MRRDTDRTISSLPGKEVSPQKMLHPCHGKERINTLTRAGMTGIIIPESNRLLPWETK